MESNAPQKKKVIKKLNWIKTKKLGLTNVFCSKNERYNQNTHQNTKKNNKNMAFNFT
jgi:hypothetical protein